MEPRTPGGDRPDQGRLDRGVGVAGAVGYLVAGGFALIVEAPEGISPWWWAVYTVGIGVFGTATMVPVSDRVGRLLLVPMVLIAVLLYLIEPDLGFSGAPTVIVAAAAGLLLPLRVALAVVVGQVLAMVAGGVLLHGDELFGVLVATLYGTLQLFAMVVGQVSTREREGREELALAHEGLSRTHQELAATHARLEKAHAELEAAQGRLAESSRTEERLRISRDLHDLVGHQLSALALNLETASHLLTGADGRAAVPVERSRVIAKDLLRDVRAVVGRLREPHADLPTELARLVAAVPQPVVHLEVARDTGPVPPERAEVVLRCVQEILTNAVRHARADNLWVSVRREGEDLLVVARDDGGGAARVVPGNGLTGMRERLEAVAGSLTVEGSGAGSGGFRVLARVPVPAGVDQP